MTASPREPSGGRPAGPPRRRSGPRLPIYRLVLAIGLLSAGPPLLIHDGWAGALPAAAAACYALYLLAGKRWPRPFRSRRVAAPGRERAEHRHERADSGHQQAQHEQAEHEQAERERAERGHEHEHEHEHEQTERLHELAERGEIAQD
ncbi:hypothetical protein ACTOB_003928 [Actinoplanes oblitus]|uniref:Uncharacterized protein n=1 Tax=Actinoplanes oblitus TaxID=3040509 RepID=A0ABY8WT04_9ACTN|nr:hypothetical protein [Actinoplanes oblitus]WIN00234.1 hypothetical protein ACTOB_003928 [Actinoplanes oblitus]